MIARQPTRGSSCTAACLGPSKYSRTLDLDPSAPMSRSPVASVPSSNMTVARFLPLAVASRWVTVRRRLLYCEERLFSVPSIYVQFRVPITNLTSTPSAIKALNIDLFSRNTFGVGICLSKSPVCALKIGKKSSLRGARFESTCAAESLLMMEVGRQSVSGTCAQ